MLSKLLNWNNIKFETLLQFEAASCFFTTQIKNFV